MHVSGRVTCGPGCLGRSRCRHASSSRGRSTTGSHNPTVSDFQYQFGIIDYELAYALLKQNRLDESQILYQEALEIMDRLARDNPQVIRYVTPGRPGVLGDLAVVYRISGKPKEAEAALREATILFETALSIDPKDRTTGDYNLANALMLPGAFTWSVATRHSLSRRVVARW